MLYCGLDVVLLSAYGGYRPGFYFSRWVNSTCFRDGTLRPCSGVTCFTPTLVERMTRYLLGFHVRSRCCSEKVFVFLCYVGVC